MANIKEVAKKANVSVATVSRVINNKGYVNEETRKLVEDAIRELNYIPNEFARSLFKKVSKTVGVIFPHLNNAFYYKVLEGIEDIAFIHGFKVMICNSNEDIDREKEYLKQFVKYNIDGLIIGSNSNLAKRYKELNIPIVTIDRIIDEEIPSVTSDNFMGGFLAAKKLAESGCKKIVHFRGPSILMTVNQRSEGFIDCLSKHNIQCDEVDLAFINPDETLIRQYLEGNLDVDGVFCDSDIIAAGVLRVLNALNLKVPNDVQVIGYDNSMISEIIIPRLTTVSQNMYTIGTEAMDTLNNMIDKVDIDELHMVIPVELVERETTK